MPSENSNQEETVTYPLKMLTPNNLQFLLNYIARDLGFTGSNGRYKTIINDYWIHSDIEMKSDTLNIDTSTDPDYNWNFDTYSPDTYAGKISNAIVYKGKVHIFGSAVSYRDDDRASQHLVGDFNKWEQQGLCPIFSTGLCNSKTVVYNNKIHLFFKNYHLSYDGSIWENIGTLPYNDGNTAYGVVVYNGKIHLLGGQSSGTPTKHYSWNGTEWLQETDIPVSYSGYNPVVYNNKIHLIGSYSSNKGKNHYSWNGSVWTQESELPQSIYTPLCIVYNNKIHMFTVTDKYYHYTWDGSEWTDLNENFEYIKTPIYKYPNGFGYNSYGAPLSAFIFNNKLFIIGTDGSNTSYWYKMPYMYYDPNDSEYPWKKFDSKTIIKYEITNIGGE